MSYKAENIKVTVNGVELKPCTAQDFYQTITEINMEHKKDYSLLRPFDLEAAKRSEKICWFKDGEEPKNFCVTPLGNVVADFRGGQENIWGPQDFRMLPLAWVEGRPVYKGDVLYDISTTAPRGAVVIQGYESPDFIVDTYGKNCEIYLTWQKPKTKREGWMNCYDHIGDNRIHATPEDAKAWAMPGCSCCVKITWEQ